MTDNAAWLHGELYAAVDHLDDLCYRLSDELTGRQMAKVELARDRLIDAITALEGPANDGSIEVTTYPNGTVAISLDVVLPEVDDGPR